MQGYKFALLYILINTNPLTLRVLPTIQGVIQIILVIEVFKKKSGIVPFVATPLKGRFIVFSQ